MEAPLEEFELTEIEPANTATDNPKEEKEQLISEGYQSGYSSIKSSNRVTSPDNTWSIHIASRSFFTQWISTRFSRCFGRRRNEENTCQKLRTVRIHVGGKEFASNRISTTKYNVLSFLPKFLFDQFRRLANLFFLFIVLIEQIPGISPTGRYGTAVPLSFVILVAAVKEIIEDLRRYKADKDVNKRVVEVLRPDRNVDEIGWTEVKVGDIVRVTNNNFFPSDLILLCSSDPSGRCYIETAILDGETSLKTREAHPLTSSYTENDLCDVQGEVECDAPNRRLYDFTGNLILRFGRDKEPITPDNILLRDSQLKNTDYVYGLVVYTGHDTKILQNTRSTVPLKRSNMDHVTNRQIILLMIVLFILAVLSSVGSFLWNEVNEDNWYLQLNTSKEEAVKHFFLSILTFVVLYNNLIPISLIVAIELAKFLQASFINKDIELYDEETNTPAQARNSNLNEELGQVQYIFSDKTGTLTQNIMTFKHCSINGELYKMDSDQSAHTEQLLSEAVHDIKVINFMRVLSLCHSVVPEHIAGELHYLATSPDEEALVNAAKQLDIVFQSARNHTLKISVLGETEEYTLLNVLDFTSTRKRMSVIIRTSNGDIKLLCKGADSVIYDRLVPNDPLVSVTEQHLDYYATKGFRTLCIAEKDLSEEQYKEWNAKYYEASVATEDRENELEEVAELIEKDLHLLGATTVEDKLQKQVPETIEKFRQAGIRVWVLTGDKMETAVNIGYSSKQLSRDMKIFLFDERSEESIRARISEELDGLQKEQKETTCTRNSALVIDGKSLSYIFQSDSTAALFLDLAVLCESVICCRTTPSQKAEVVELVQRKVKGTITLAIGDGANDVSMIRAAHIGVGISGREGLQATLASDYSIAQFRFLGKLLLVHGAWNYQRQAKLIFYSFYKNISLYITELWFAFCNGFSGQPIFQRWTIALYNIGFTALPIMVIALLDQDVSSETRLRKPNLYSKGDRYSYKRFWGWILLSLAHSLTFFYVTYGAIPLGTPLSNGQTTDLLYVGNIIYSVNIITVTLQAGLETDYWTIFNHFTYWGSIAGWFIFIVPFSHLWPTFPIAEDMVGQDMVLYSSLMFYAVLPLAPAIALIPVLIYKWIRQVIFPSDVLLARQEDAYANRNACCAQKKKYQKF